MTLIECMNNHLSSFFSLLAASFTFSLLAAALSSDLAENKRIKQFTFLAPFGTVCLKPCTPRDN